MLIKTRLILDGSRDPYTNMALDESILLNAAKNNIPTLRIYRWTPSSVSIGYFQKIKDTVNLDYCKINHIPVVRRITGGGAVYHDSMGEITYSMVINEKQLESKTIQDSMEKICLGIVIALKKVGINAEFQPVNDIIASGKKISGSAQTKRGEWILQHGTLLVSSRIEKMAKALRISKEKQLYR